MQLLSTTHVVTKINMNQRSNNGLTEGSDEVLVGDPEAVVSLPPVQDLAGEQVHVGACENNNR